MSSLIGLRKYPIQSPPLLYIVYAWCYDILPACPIVFVLKCVYLFVRKALIAYGRAIIHPNDPKYLYIISQL